MDINNVYVRDAILYYTIQQYFNCNDNKTSQFIAQLDHFNYRSGLIHNIPYLSLQLHVSEKDFYHTYLRVKESFKTLPEDVILVKKGDEIYSKHIYLDVLKLFLRVPHEVWGDMRCYLLYIFMGIIAIFLYNFFSAYLRSIGNSVIPLIFLAISSILNIILDLYFVLVLKMGVGGAALATVLSQYVSGIGIMLYTLLKYKEVLVIFKISYLKRERIKQIISFSLLTCIQQSVMNLGILMVQGLVNSFGTVVMAAFAAAVKIDAFAYMPVQDFGNAFSTFIAQNYGAKERERIQKGLKEAVRISSIFCIIISILVYIFAKPLMMIFIDAKETSIILEGVRYLRIEGAFYIGIGCLFLLYGLYRALGRPGMSVVLTVFSLGTRVALAYIFSSIPALGVIGIWWSVPIGWALADIVGLVYYKKNKHNLLSLGGVL